MLILRIMGGKTPVTLGGPWRVAVVDRAPRLRIPHSNPLKPEHRLKAQAAKRTPECIGQLVLTVERHALVWTGNRTSEFW